MSGRDVDEDGVAAPTYNATPRHYPVVPGMGSSCERSPTSTSQIRRASIVPERCRPGTVNVAVGVPEPSGVAFAEVSVDTVVSASEAAMFVLRAASDE